MEKRITLRKYESVKLKKKYNHPLFRSFLEELLNPSYIKKKMKVLGYYDTCPDGKKTIPNTLRNVKEVYNRLEPKYTSIDQRTEPEPVCFCGVKIRYEVYLHDPKNEGECLFTLGSCCVKEIDDTLLKKKCEICGGLNPTRSDFCKACRH